MPEILVTILQIITLIAGAATTILACVYFIMTVIRKHKQSNHLDYMGDDTLFDKIYAKIPEYMEVAENMYNTIGSKLGSSKLSDVLNKIKMDCVSNNKEYDETFWKDKIEKFVDFSKNVNTKR